MKKRILWTLLCVLMIIPTFAFFGCNKNSSSATVLANLQTTITSFDETDSAMSQETIGSATGYKLKDFATKNSSDVKIDDDQNYVILNAAAIKYIKNCSEIINSMEKKNISHLDSSVKEFNKAYKDLKEKHAKLAKFDSYDYNIWNGVFAQYKLSAKNFIEKEYDLALKLGDYLINKEKITKNFATDEQTTNDIDIFTNYQEIKLCDDMCRFVIYSCQGQKENETTANAIKSRLENIWNNLIFKNNKEITKETAENFANISKVMDNQRKIYQKAISKFSFFDYVAKYGKDIDAYSKKLKNAKIYLDAIKNYESSTSNYTKSYYEYILNNVKA